MVCELIRFTFSAQLVCRKLSRFHKIRNPTQNIFGKNFRAKVKSARKRSKNGKRAETVSITIVHDSKFFNCFF